MGLDHGRRGSAARFCGVVLASTPVLTAAFFGVLALVDGGNDGVGGRLPGFVVLRAPTCGFVPSLADR